VPELVPEDVARNSHYKLDQAAPIARVEDLANYDAIVVGAGTRFGRLSSQMANFLDQAGGLWMRGALHRKVGGAFTSSATQHGGQEATLVPVARLTAPRQLGAEGHKVAEIANNCTAETSRYGPHSHMCSFQ
jgi:NAD(P)H:quinone oxidoreductase type IV